MSAETETVKEIRLPKAGSQGARLLHALQDRAWHSTSDLDRSCGEIVVSATVTSLRNLGYTIEHRVLKGKARPALANQYRLLNPPLALPATGTEKIKRTILDRDSIPRTKANRYRIYRVLAGKLELVAVCGDPCKLGKILIEYGARDEFTQSCLGLLDTYGTTSVSGTWLISPFDTEQR